jgi:hypothetical protein
MKCRNRILTLRRDTTSRCDSAFLREHNSSSPREDGDRARDGAEGMPGQERDGRAFEPVKPKTARTWRRRDERPVLLKSPACTAIPSTRVHCR